MIKRIKQWLFERFLPMLAKETLLADYRRLTKENEALLLQLAEKDAYIDGLQTGMKAIRRIVINTGEGVKK